MRRQDHGFTLVELLAAVSIIAVFAALLAPVVVASRESARRARCQSNLSQIARAFESYCSDYSGCYPNTGSQYLWAGFYWREPMRGYLSISKTPGAGGERQSVLSCPSDPTPPGLFAATSYAYSASFYMSPEQVNAVADNDFIRSKFAATNPKLPCSSMKTTHVRHASKKVMVAEYWTLHSDNPRVGWYDGPETGSDPWSGARNYLFADGHVRYIETKRIRPADSPTASRPRSLPDINLTADGIAGRDID